jgi:hypothetical protein
MRTILIIKTKDNTEIARKILNSVAHKYDCGVEFRIEDGRLSFDGDRDCAVEIVREAFNVG